MPIRDLLLFGAFAAVTPIILFHPYIGALTWVVFGLLNPHRLAFGYAYNFPFAMIVGIATLIGIVLTRDHRELKGGVAGIVLLAMIIWMSLTTIYALTPDAAVEMWNRVVKILGMTFVIMLLLHTKRQVDLLVAVIALSIAYYGVKGGIFTIVTGASGMVFGPDDSVMAGSNALGVANVMTIPLLIHFYQQARNRWVRLASLAAALLCAAATLGSYSRGAFLALGVMGFILWIRSSHKAVTAALVVTVALVLIPVMPDRWHQRMDSIETYEDDGSAMSRIHAWRAAWNIATDRFFGGGFEYPSPEVVAKYSPGPAINTDHAVFVAHSIYFQTLGEHGFVGLALFLLFWILVWRQCAAVRRQTRDRPDLRWAFSLMSMTQASIAGYTVGGAFLNIAFWDMPYYLYAVVVVTDFVVRKTVGATETAGTSNPFRKRLGVALQ